MTREIRHETLGLKAEKREHTKLVQNCNGGDVDVVAM